MTFQTIKYDKDAKIAIVTLNRPDKLNAMNLQCVEELRQVLDAIEQDEEVWVAIVTGGDTVFSAGADISVISSLSSPTEHYRFSRRFQQLFQRVEDLEKPVIAAVCGLALGGGCELVLACDLRIVSETARFGFPEINIGGFPAAGGTQKLPRLIGAPKAKELLFTGAQIDGREAYRIGLVNRVVPGDQVMKEARTLAEAISSKPKLSISKMKRLVNVGINMDLESALMYESECLSSLSSTEDFKEGARAFLEKRKPNFVGK